MDPKFNEIYTSPENEIFKVVFFPDRIYHAEYLNATRSARYRYNVQEVRQKLDISILKGEVYMDGMYYTNFFRIEYRASRLVEQARIIHRFLKNELIAWVNLTEYNVESFVKLHFDAWINAYQVEVWGNLEPPTNKTHDFMVQELMGLDNQIIRVKEFDKPISDIKKVRQIEIAFRENNIDMPFGLQISDPRWDNNYERTIQQPIRKEPNSSENTVQVLNYLIDFRRGWFLDSLDIEPVRYLNALMEENNTEVKENNIIEMKWILQQELGSGLVFFHEVNIPPGNVEGTHQHIGSEELYYIVSGEGIAYMGADDDPTSLNYPIIERDIFGVGKRKCRELPIKQGNVIYTKSGGIHGIRNMGRTPLKFVAFLYHTH